MVVLVIGGSGSGKSEYAEQRCMQFDTKRKLYIATMEPYGEEGQMRVLRHRRLRAGKGFETLECYTHLEDAEIPEGGTVLLECMSNLAANEMFSPAGRRDDPARAILQGVDRLLLRAENAVLVTNEVFSDGITYAPETEQYRHVLARINRELARRSDEVVEVVHGLPVFLNSMSFGAADREDRIR